MSTYNRIIMQAMAQASAQQQSLNSTNIATALANAYTSTSATGGSIVNNPVVWVTMPTGTALASMQAAQITSNGAIWYDGAAAAVGGETIVPPGREHVVFLPDGAMVVVAKDGSYDIADKDAKVTYRANRVRDFNSYVNASDKLEDFIKFCGAAGVRQGDMLGIPIKLFIEWLIVEAARADSEPNLPALPDMAPIAKPRCSRCARFLSRKLVERGMTFCRTICFERELAETA